MDRGSRVRWRWRFLVGQAGLVLVEPAFEDGDRGGEVVAEDDEQVEVVEVFSAAEASATDKASNGSLIQQITISYDVFGNRSEEDVYSAATGQTTVQKFAYEANGNLWADLNANGSLATRYILGDQPNQLLARVNGSGVGWYLTDHLGSVRDITNAAGRWWMPRVMMRMGIW